MAVAMGRAVAGQQRTQAQQWLQRQQTQAQQQTPERHETHERQQHARVRLMGWTRTYGVLVRIGRAWFRGWTLYVASIRER